MYAIGFSAKAFSKSGGMMKASTASKASQESFSFALWIVV